MTRKRVETGDLFAPVEYPPTIEQAHALGALGQAVVEEHANDAWLAAASLWIMRLPPGARFIAEDVVIAIEDVGQWTPNRKAIGPVVHALARAGIIAKTGAARPARTSHGSLKPEWERL